MDDVCSKMLLWLDIKICWFFMPWLQFKIYKIFLWTKIYVIVNSWENPQPILQYWQIFLKEFGSPLKFIVHLFREVSSIKYIMILFSLGFVCNLGFFNCWLISILSNLAGILQPNQPIRFFGSIKFICFFFR